MPANPPRPDSLYTYVILLTAREGRDDRIEGLQAGADDFLCKPPDTAELVAHLNVARRILEMQDQLRAHAAQLVELQSALGARICFWPNGPRPTPSRAWPTAGSSTSRWRRRWISPHVMDNLSRS